MHNMFGWKPRKTKLPNALSIVELKSIIRFMKSEMLQAGVDSLDIDMDKQKVTVTGYVEKGKVLRIVRRTGRKAEYWPFPYDSEYYPYASEYLDESTFASSYNYYRHGYNESVYGYFPDQAYCTVQDETVFLFSDDNVHAPCTIM
ncbi:Heavy metal-associated isoprenylated plant protein 45, partial [Mucuna pruriens]